MFKFMERRSCLSICCALAPALLLLALLGAPARRGHAEAGPSWSVWGGRIGPVAADGDGRAYLAWGTRIQQLSDPLAPLSLRDGPRLPEVVEGLAVGQGLLAATSRAPSGAAAAQLRLWSLTDGPEPVPLGEVIDLPGKEVGAVAIGYARAVVVTARGLAVLRLKDPEAPTLEAEFAAHAPAGARAWDGRIALAGGRVWLARPWGLESLDLSRLESAPGSLALQRQDGSATRDVAAFGDRVFALRADGRLTVLEATSGRVLAETTVAEQPLAVAADRGRLAVVDQGGRRLRRFTMAGDWPVWQGDETLPPQGSNQAHFVLSGEDALLSLEGAGLLRWAPSTAAVQVLPLLPAPRQVWPMPERVWVAAGAAGIWWLDGAADGLSPDIRGKLLLTGPAGFHLADPGTPSAERAVEIQAVAADDTAVFVLTARDGLVVLRRDGPEGLEMTGHLPGLATAPGAAGLLLLERRLVGLGPGGAVWTVDVSDGARPRLLGVTADLGIMDMAPLQGGRMAFVGMGALGRGRFGVAAVPATGALSPPDAWLDLDAVFSRVAATGREAVLSGAGDGIALVDTAAAAGPRLVRRIPGGASGRAVLRGDLLLLAEEQDLDHLLRLPGGSLRALGRVALPSSGLDGGDGRDAIGAGAVLYLPRGRAGILRLAAAPEAAAAPAADARATALILPALAVRGEPLAEGCDRMDTWLLLLDDRLLGVGAAPREASLVEGVNSLAMDLRRAGKTVRLGRYGSQAELLADDGQPRLGGDGITEGSRGRADLGLALGLRLLEMDPPGRLGILVTVAGPIDAQSQRLMDRQAALLDARGMPLLRLDAGGDGLGATGPALVGRGALRTAVREGDWDSLARELARTCW